MKNLCTVFSIVQKYCAKSGRASGKCFEELEKAAAYNHLFFPLYTYLKVLQALGLIKIYRFRNLIIMTEKGVYTDAGSISKITARLLMFLYFAERILEVFFFLIVFWPAHLAVQTQYHHHRNNESSHRKNRVDELN